jgi:hypothetical protein
VAFGFRSQLPTTHHPFNFNVDLGPVLKFEHLAKLHSADQLKVFWPMEHASFVSVRSHECPDGFRCDQACHVVAGPSGEIERPGSGTGELRSVAARRKTATRGAGTHGGRTVTRNYRRAVESVLEGYGIEKSSVSRQFVAASSNQLRVLCERRLEDLNLVVLMIDGIHFGGQVLVVALGIAESGEKPERDTRRAERESRFFRIWADPPIAGFEGRKLSLFATRLCRSVTL